MSSVFIIDDHPVIRLAIRMLLEHEGYKVVGETDNGVDALQMVRDSMPDLIVLDISIPKLDGLELLLRFGALDKSLRVLVLTAQSPALFAGRCMQAGACGYVCKQEDLSEVLSAMKAVLCGYNYFPSHALQTPRQDETSNDELNRLMLLSDRELMVLQLFAKGSTSTQIANSIFLSGKTVSTYKKRIMHKLRATSMAELIELAQRHELV
ncbi:MULTISPECIES: response regulator transcription factor [Pseudomonas]|jgi:two-component system response regulator EvgA|uniref:Two-component transcriptional response regulator, LuxR family n=4 Tax=Pseudomonas chlororaphis TaxID=587753 RepID=A0A0E1E8L4_9PSED|nr:MULTISPECIES: response regulator transcription factor [Pseudomonas]AIC21374.1 LuxR family transcriptional regulator [Pseudomonas chlororaphis]AIS11964.1 LuxR family transcriptional regulator [Pseudomonas chlororaphis subsp. aurantiaca]AZD23550.1 Two-component transcriptional response regulator, LuxR family [Pseudomonas chlororaphis subsp. aurantiaca]AZD30912.1 Two-component transcriptional response regulator, LuxR family [Pseudomonas chlororaphis]AZD37230.1 Two-component transcriptional res